MRMSLPLCQTFGSLETDIDRLPWDDELVTQAPKYVDGYLIVPNRAGWGRDLSKTECERIHPKDRGGLVQPRDLAAFQT